MVEQKSNTLESADILKIMKYLPHRYPFLMIDKIIEIDTDNSCIGIKNVTFNEPHFLGHFPGQPVMPGVLIIEAMAQTAGVLCASSLESDFSPTLVYLMTLDKVKFRKPVVPGDVVRIPVEKIKKRGLIWRFKAEALVDDEIVAEAEICAMMVEESEK